MTSITMMNDALVLNDYVVKKNQCKKMMDDKIIGDQTHAETIHSTKKWVHVTLQNHLEIVLLNTQLIVRPGM